MVLIASRFVLIYHQKMEAEIIKIRSDKRKITSYTYILSILLASITSSCFSIITGLAYRLNIQIGIILAVSIGFSIIATMIMTRKRNLWTLLLITIIPIVIILLYLLDISKIQNSLSNLIKFIKNYNESGELITVGRKSSAISSYTKVFISYNILISLITSYVIIYRKPSLFAIVALIPYIGLIINIADEDPNALCGVLAIFSVIILLIFGRVRKNKDSDKTLVALSLPVLSVILFLNLLFPQETYNKDRLANKGIRATKRLVTKVLSDSKTRDAIQKTLNRMDEEQRESVENFAATSGLLGGPGEFEDLSHVGNLEYEKQKLGEYEVLPMLGSGPDSSCDYVYLRNKSFDFYYDNLWTNDYEKYVYMEDLPRPEDARPLYEYARVYVTEIGQNSVVTSLHYIDEEDVTEDDTIIAVSSDPNGSIRIPDNVNDGDVLRFYIGLDFHTRDWDQSLYSYNPNGYTERAQCEFSINITNVLASACIPYYFDGYVSSYMAKTPLINNMTDPYDYLLHINSKNYRFSTTPQKAGDIYPSGYTENYVNDVCLFVPEDTRQQLINSNALPDWYISLLNGETQMDDADKIRAVCDYVRNLHPYDLDTDFPPTDKDFVLWFITESNTGFCVHYATTAVILLRMIGVPARYVSGYLIDDIRFGEKKDITTDDAHAWIEVFIPDLGWILDDPTPGNEKAASMYNIDAIAKVYPEYEQKTEVPTSNAITKVKNMIPVAPSDPIRKASRFNRDTIITVILVTLLISAIALPIVSRIIYVSRWNKRFTDGDINNRARAYYNYYEKLFSIFKVKPDNKIYAIAQVAAFSNRKISDEEFDTMLMLARSQLDKLKNQHGFIKNIKCRLLSVNKK